MIRFKNKESLIFKLFTLSYIIIYLNTSLKLGYNSAAEGYGPGIFPIIISLCFFFLFFFFFLFYLILKNKKKETLNADQELKKNDYAKFFSIIIFPLFFINFLGIYIYLAIVLCYFNFKYSISFKVSLVFTTIVLFSIFFLSKLIKLSLPIGIF